MKLTSLAYATLAAAGLVAAIPAAPAFAVSNIDSYVSTTGLDTNNCSLTAPCQTMAHAIGQTVSGGVVHCLDSGDFAGATITQSITIDCSNTTAGAGPFTINGTNTVVHLIGLQMWGSFGINVDFQQGAALHVEKCKIFENTGNGIFFEPSSNAKLFVSDSYFTQNFGNVVGAIYIKPASGIAAEVAINNSRIVDNQFGIIADGNAGGTISGTVSNSVIAGNSGNGITVSTTSTSAMLVIDQSQVIGNAHGLVAGGSNAGMLVRNTTVTDNSTGLYTVNSGTLFSYLNNSVNGNITDGAFTGTVALK